MHFRFEVGALWHQFLSTRDGVMGTSRGIGDELRQVGAIERHVKATGDICDEWSWFETGLRQV